MKKIILIIFLLLSTLHINAEVHIVTSESDDGDGSLRSVVAGANTGDTIMFSPNVDTITLMSGQIIINKNLTIIGKDKDKKTIISNGNDAPYMENRIFSIQVSNITFNISNLILENGKSDARSGCIDIYSSIKNVENCMLYATNCMFNKNEGGSGGAVFVGFNNNFIATSCIFYQNGNNAIGIVENSSCLAVNCIFINNINAAVVIAHNSNNYAYRCFIAINCVFSENASEYQGGVVVAGNGSCFIGLNCIFNENKGKWNGGGIYTHNNGNAVYLYHCSFNKNQTDSIGAGIFIDSLNRLYSYNSIYTANEENGTITEEGQIRGEVLGGNNLIDNGTTITHETVFGNNEFNGKYIMPVDGIARTATKLTASDIETPDNVPADSIIYWLSKDYRGKDRPDTGFVTFGAVECDFEEIKDGEIIIVNPVDNEFEIIFHNLKKQKISIELFDLEGKRILNIFEGISGEGKQTYKVNTNELAIGLYFVRLVTNDSSVIKKIIVKK